MAGRALRMLAGWAGLRPGITLWRRMTQFAFFIAFTYGALLLKAELNASPVLPAIKAPPGQPSTTRFQPGQILWASSDPPVIDTYPPAAICRFNPRGGIAKACVVHFLSENITWRTPLKHLLPHFLLFMILAFLVGRWWCGWACPLGTVGDVLTWLRVRLGMRHVTASSALRRGLRAGAYGVFSGTLFISWLAGLKRFAPVQCQLFLPYCQICPGRLLCPLFGGSAPSWKDFSNAVASVATVVAWAVLGLFAMAFFVGRRLWCHVCPIGLVVSWFNRGAGLRLRKTESTRCNRCAACADACPMGLTHVRESKEVQSLAHPQCISCMRCVDICPRDECLKVDFFGIPVARSSMKPGRASE